VELIARILGIIAIVVSILSMVFKKKTTIMLCLTIYNLLTLTSYLLIGQYLGCVLVGIATIRAFLYFILSYKNIKPNLAIYIIFNVLVIVSSILLWGAWFDVFMLLKLLINCYTTWQTNVKVIKLGTIIYTPLSILYNIFAGAYVYIISSTAFGVVALVSLLLMIKEEKKTKFKKETLEKKGEVLVLEGGNDREN